MIDNLQAQLTLFQNRYNKIHEEVINLEYQSIIKDDIIAKLEKQLKEITTDGSIVE